VGTWGLCNSTWGDVAVHVPAASLENGLNELGELREGHEVILVLDSVKQGLHVAGRKPSSSRSGTRGPFSFQGCRT